MNDATSALEATQPPRRPIGQATLVEQSRALAEMRAAIVVAQQQPRDIARAMAAMREACQNAFLAERAFFRYARGASQVTGPSIHLARELARSWGNIGYGHKELARDDERGESEMLAFAWDLETNARAEATFIVPMKRLTKPLTELRDVYENNASIAARRLRECIFAVLPVWYTEDAKERCRATLEHGGGKPIAQRIADGLAGFGGIGVTRSQVERKLGRSADKWTAEDLAALAILVKSIKAGETTAEDEFPRRDGDKRRLAAPMSDAFEKAAAGTKSEPPADSAPSTERPARG